MDGNNSRMEKVALEDVEEFLTNATVMKPISRAINASDVAINHFEVDPGDAFSATLHTHLDQEEIFYVLSGTATFETDEGWIDVGADEVVRFEPGEYQQGYNDGDKRVVAIAMGAPPESETVYMVCRTCGERVEPVMRMSQNRDRLDVECSSCGATIANLT